MGFGVLSIARAAVLAALLASVSSSAVSLAATSSSPLQLSLRRAEVFGTLILSASSASATTTLVVKGDLHTKSRGQLAITSCSDIDCAHRERRATIYRIHKGSHQLSVDRTMRRSVAVRIQLAIGRFHESIDLVATRPIAAVPASAAPTQAPVPTAMPVPTSATTTPTAPLTFELTTSPRLDPPYDAAVSDYTVACEPAGAVIIRATVPSGQTLSINGGPALNGSVVETIPLRADQAFMFTLTDTTGSTTHEVRCTPADFPSWTVERDGTPDVDWIALTPPGGGPYAVITDNWGVPVWWMRSPTGSIANASVLPSGHVAWWNVGGESGDGEEGYYSIYDLDGKLVNSVAASTSDGHGEIGANVHDLEELPNGDFLLLAYVPVSGVNLEPHVGNSDATVLDAVIQLISPTGELLWSWDSDGTVYREGTYSEGSAIGLGETDWAFAGTPILWNGEPVYDVIHMNSIQEVDKGDCVATMSCEIVFSARHLDAVYGISMATGAMSWKLGGTKVPGESLEFVDDPYGTFTGNHFARILPNGHLTVHDNGTLAGRAPRAAQYEINNTNRTATLTSQVTDPRASHSICCGSATLMPGGDWLISWGGNGIVSELAPDGTPVLTLSFPSGFSYRAYDVTSDQIDRHALIGGMNARTAQP
jgi:hypothetical protein